MAVKPMRLAIVFGTRPEAIKLAPVIHRLQAQPGRFRVTVVVTAQHRDMLDEVLRLTRIRPDVDLDLMRTNQTPAGLTAAALAGLAEVFSGRRLNAVLVQGDTATTVAAALAAFYQKIPVGHVEAGLRTGDLEHPFPEEGNRRLVTVLAQWHFAATPSARAHLRSEGVLARQIFVTGNPVVDALRSLANARPGDGLASGGPVVITAHRRENFGKPLEVICQGVRGLALRFPEREFVFPVHRNPVIRRTVRHTLSRPPGNLKIVPPLPYDRFIRLLQQARLVITDSGGIQEEATTLGVPILILRRRTERPEALQAGAQLIPMESGRWVHVAASMLRRPQPPRRDTAWFGDGRASERIAQALAWISGQSRRRPADFKP